MTARRPTAPPPVVDGYEYVRELGTGGYSDVYLYQQHEPKMKVAVKVLTAAGLTDAVRRQFTAEANVMAELADHPFIVQVFRAGIAADGRPYLIMKYYPNSNLKERASSEHLSVPEVLRIGIRIASAVETAHRAGILHRDIKPANVLTSQYGDPGLTDFGIAVAMGEEPAEEAEGMSIPWAPPEVIFGKARADERSDVYSLGATVWHLLVGRSPFELPGGNNKSHALMARIASTPPPATGRSDVPASLERVLRQALAKDPTRRPASAYAFALALQSIEQEQSLSATEIRVSQRPGDDEIPSGSRARPRRPDGDVDEDATRVRSPVVVNPAGPAPRRVTQVTQATPVLPRRDPLPAMLDSAWNPSTGQGVAPGTQAETDLAHHGRDRAVGSYERPADVTDRPPTVLVDTAGAPAPPREPKRLSRVTVVALAAGVTAVLIGIGVLVMAKGNGAAASRTSTPPVSDDSTQSAVDPNEFVAPGAPRVVITRDEATHATVTWSYDGPRADDDFQWKSTSPTASGIAVDRQLSLTTKAGQKTCVQVRVRRHGGALSEWSGQQCLG
ncbi:MAG: pknK [Frankiales bacterium]|nr:pknK [Frankiales bacterium]